MKKILLTLLILSLFGSASLFGQNKKSISEKAVVQNSVNLIEGEDYSVEIPASWKLNMVRQDVGGMVLEFMAVAEDGATNILLQTTEGDPEGMSEREFLGAMVAMVGAMADEIEILGETEDRMCYCVTIEGQLVVQDVFCIFGDGKIYVFAASTTLEAYESYADIFDAVYESFEITE